jgi:hypothetical protein
MAEGRQVPCKEVRQAHLCSKGSSTSNSTTCTQHSSRRRRVVQLQEQRKQRTSCWRCARTHCLLEAARHHIGCTCHVCGVSMILQLPPYLRHDCRALQHCAQRQPPSVLAHHPHTHSVGAVLRHRGQLHPRRILPVVALNAALQPGGARRGVQIHRSFHGMLPRSAGLNSFAGGP